MDRRTQLIELQRNWKPPEELTRSCPRPVRLSGGGKGLLVAAVALFAGALAGSAILAGFGARQAEEQRLLGDHGAEASAVVTRVWRSRGEERQPWVAYQFTAGGHIYERQVKAPLQIWKTLQSGSFLPVRYLPSNPKLNHPLEWQDKPMPVWIPYLVGAVLAAFGCICAFSMLGQRRLVEDGRPAPAVVTKLTKTQHGKVTHYEFALLSGAVVKGKNGPSHHPPAVDSTICVLYDPFNPRRNAPYPLSLVRPAFLPHQRTPLPSTAKPSAARRGYLLLHR
jgi:hypothetical protein